MTNPLDLPLEMLIPKTNEDRCLREEILDVAVSRHRDNKNVLNAYRHWSPSANKRSGILSGIPVSIKDLFGLYGFETYSGTPCPLPVKWQLEGAVVSSLRNAGAVFTGKTHMVEFAFGGLGTNPHWPTPANPWGVNEAHVPGGSSSGAGVSIQEGSALVALGSDTAGSVRIPASFTGTVGLKTTKNRWSTDGLVPLSHSLDTPGIIARSVADLAVVFSIIDPETTTSFDQFLATLRSQDLFGLKLGTCTWFFEDCDPSIVELIKSKMRVLEKKGASFSKIKSSVISHASKIFARGGLAAPEFAALINNEFADWKEKLDPNVRSRFERMENITSQDYNHRLHRLATLADEIDMVFSDVEVLVGPTVPISPPSIEEVMDPKTYHVLNMQALRNTSIVNLLNLCALTIPVGLDDKGFPVGFQLIGRRGADKKLLAVALAIECALGSAFEAIGRAPLVKV